MRSKKRKESLLMHNNEELQKYDYSGGFETSMIGSLSARAQVGLVGSIGGIAGLAIMDALLGVGEWALLPEGIVGIATYFGIRFYLKKNKIDLFAQFKNLNWDALLPGYEGQVVESALDVTPDEDNGMPHFDDLSLNDQSAYSIIIRNRGNNDILLGHDKEGQEIRRTWKQLKAILILGLQGGGKTTTAVWLMSQALAQGAKLAVIDKHAKSEEDSMMQKIGPFTPFFDCSPGVDPDSALQVVNHVRRVFEVREDGAPCDYPLLLIVDEFSAIMGKINKDGNKWQEAAKALADLIEELNQEGRKHKVYAICIGQVTNASRSGGTEIRDLFNTRIVHGMRVKQAQMLSLNEHVKDIRALDQGQVIVDMEGRDEPFFVQVPYISDGDIRALADFLRANNVSEHIVEQLELPMMAPLPQKSDPIVIVPQSQSVFNLDSIIALAGKVSDETLLKLIDLLPDVNREEEEESVLFMADEPNLPKPHEPTLLERGLKAYEEGFTTIDDLAARLAITPWEARNLRSQIKVALKQEDLCE